MGNNIFNNFDFKPSDKKNGKNKLDLTKYFNIIKEELKNIIGDFDYIKVEVSNSEISLITKDRECIYDFTFKGDKYILDDFLFQSIDTFREYVIQVISKYCISTIKSSYKRGRLKTLPETIKMEYTIDLSKLTNEWLENSFNENAEEYGNGESIESLISENIKDGIEFIFDVDCGRYGLHRGQSIKVTNRGNITIDFSETPIERGDLECAIKNQIEKLIKSK